MNGVIKLLVKSPYDCNKDELDAFTKLVEVGNTTNIEGLEERVSSAYKLSFLYEDIKLIGCMGLKNPTESYREDIQTKSHFDLDCCAYPFEIGWLHIIKTHRHKGFSHILRASLLSFTVTKGVFTTIEESPKIIGILQAQGFKKAGDTFISSISNKKLNLFVKKPLT